MWTGVGEHWTIDRLSDRRTGRNEQLLGIIWSELRGAKGRKREKEEEGKKASLLAEASRQVGEAEKWKSGKVEERRSGESLPAAMAAGKQRARRLRVR